jgi:hypothetical protein
MKHGNTRPGVSELNFGRANGYRRVSQSPDMCGGQVLEHEATEEDWRMFEGGQHSTGKLPYDGSAWLRVAVIDHGSGGDGL